MEIERAALTEIVKGGGTGKLKPGGFLRVEVLKSLGGKSFLVEFKGNRHVAFFDGSPSGRLFIARVRKVSPKIELQFIRALDKGPPSNFKLEKTEIQKSFIQKLLTTDNFFEKLIVYLGSNKRNIIRSLKKSIGGRKLLNMKPSRDLSEFLILQGLQNLADAHTYNALLPLQIGPDRYPGELKVLGGPESPSRGVILKIHLKSERKIIFLVFMDYESIHCSIATNSEGVRSRIYENRKLLLSGLQSIYYNREIKISFIPWEDKDFQDFGSIKKIDVKL